MDYKSGAKALEKGKYEKAVEKFEKAIEEEESVADCYRGIGIAKFQLTDYEGALSAFEEAVSEGAKETATLYDMMGAAAMELEQYEAAAGYYEKAVTYDDATDEMMQEMLYNIVVCYEQVQDVEAAKAAIAAYTERYPDDEEAAREAVFLETR